MKHARLILVALTVLLVVSFDLYAEKVEEDSAEEAQIELKQQTHCLVMGGEIDPKLYTDIQGQRVTFCCPMCDEKLKAEPDKYFKKAAEEGVLFENIQTNCPVSGEELKEKSLFIDHEGRRVYFCCQSCVDSFKGDPDKYLEQMDTPSGEQAGHIHQGHNH